MQLRARNQLVERERGLQRDHPVVATVDDQRLVLDGADVGFGAGHGIDPALARRGEHGREALLEARADAGLVAQLRQFVIDQRTVPGEVIHDAAHVLEARGIAPHRVEPLGDLEGHADAAHQHQPAHALGMADGQCQGQRATEGITDQVRLLDAQRVEQANRLLDPVIHRVVVVRRACGETEARHVRRDDPSLLGQRRHDQAPVGPGRYPRPGTMDHQHRETFAHVVVVGLQAGRQDGLADFGAGRGHDDAHSFTQMFLSSV